MEPIRPVKYRASMSEKTLRAWAQKAQEYIDCAESELRRLTTIEEAVIKLARFLDQF